MWVSRAQGRAASRLEGPAAHSSELRYRGSHQPREATERPRWLVRAEMGGQCQVHGGFQRLCKGPEAGGCLVCLRQVWLEWREGGGERGEAMKAERCLVVRVAVSVLPPDCCPFGQGLRLPCKFL